MIGIWRKRHPNVRRRVAAFAALALVGSGSAMLATATNANATSSPTASGSASRSCPSGTVTGTVNATGIPGPNSSGHYQGLLFLTYQGNTLDQEVSNAHGDVTFNFSTNAVPQDATSFTVNIQSPTQSGGVNIPVSLSVNTCAPPVKKPQASFTDSVSGQVANFDASGSDNGGGTLTYSWNFGDGTTGSGETTSHTYAKSDTDKTYSVKLTVANSAGSDQASDNVTIKGTPPPPPPDQSISAKALNDHGCNAYQWQFVITQVDKQSDAPASVHVTWANGQSADVALSSFTGGVAHYVTTGNLGSTVTSATAQIYGDWSGQFNLSDGPCAPPPPTTKTVHVKVTATPCPGDQCTVSATLELTGVTQDWVNQYDATIPVTLSDGSTVNATLVSFLNGTATYTVATHGKTVTDATAVVPDNWCTCGGKFVVSSYQCKPKPKQVTPLQPTHTTPDCTSQNETVTPRDQEGVIWTPSGSTTLKPTQTVTYTAAPAPGYVFPSGAQTSWTFTNNLDVSKCTATSGSATRDCTSGTVTGTVNATGIPGPNDSGHYQGLLFLTYQGSVIDQEVSDANGDVTFNFSTDAVPQLATSFTVEIQSPTQSGGVDIPVNLSVDLCGTPPPPPHKQVVRVSVTFLGAVCGPVANETGKVVYDHSKVNVVVTVAGKQVGDSFTVPSGKPWSVVATVKNASKYMFPNGKASEHFSGKNNEKPFKCPTPPKHHKPGPPKHHPVPPTPPAPPSNNFPVQSPTSGSGISWLDNPAALTGLALLLFGGAIGFGLMFTRRRPAHARAATRF